MSNSNTSGFLEAIEHHSPAHSPRERWWLVCLCYWLHTESRRRKLRISCRHGSPCSTIVLFSLATFFTVTIAGHVSGSKLEATEGHDVTILFETGLERVDEVRIIFGEGKSKLLLAQYCSPDADPICDPIETSQLQVKGGNVSFILVNVDISRSGIYTAQVITDNVVSEVTTTLVVNQAPVSSTASHPHSSSSPTPPHSSDLQWLYALITAVIIIFIFIILVFCFYCRRKEIPCFNGKKESGSSSNVSVSMNGGGETDEALLTVTSVS